MVPGTLSSVIPKCRVRSYPQALPNVIIINHYSFLHNVLTNLCTNRVILWKRTSMENELTFASYDVKFTTDYLINLCKSIYPFNLFFPLLHWFAYLFICLLALCLGLTTGRIQGTIWGARDRIWVSHIHEKCCRHCLVSLVQLRKIFYGSGNQTQVSLMQGKYFAHGITSSPFKKSAESHTSKNRNNIFTLLLSAVFCFV